MYPRLWLVYLVLSSLAVAGNLFAAAFDPENTKASHVVGIVISVTGIIPLYGFVRQRTYNPRWLWKIVLTIGILGALVVIGACIYVALANASFLPILIGAFVAGLCGPYLFAVYQYVFRSPGLWQ